MVAIEKLAGLRQIVTKYEKQIMNREVRILKRIKDLFLLWQFVRHKEEQLHESWVCKSRVGKLKQIDKNVSKFDELEDSLTCRNSARKFTTEWKSSQSYWGKIELQNTQTFTIEDRILKWKMSILWNIWVLISVIKTEMTEMRNTQTFSIKVPLTIKYTEGIQLENVNSFKYMGSYVSVKEGDFSNK